MKILFYASYPNLQIGYSRVGNILTNYLAECGHEIFYFGISNFKDGKKVDRYVHPNITLIDALEEETKLGNDEMFGVNSVCKYIIDLKPDIFFVYNDVVVISRIFNNFIDMQLDVTFKVITYLDLVYSYEKPKLIKHIDRFSHKILVFTKYWKDNLIDMGVDENKIDILPHGFYKKDFFPIVSSQAKKYFGFNEDDFIILNSNRNSYRKCIDKTIDAFILFLIRKNLAKNIKLFLNMDTKNYHESGYDITNQLQISCMKYKADYETIVNNHVFINETNKLSDIDLNILYNACDIGLNTCAGEGFGLCNFEHGLIGKAQIISNVGGLSDIFDSEYATKIEPVGEYYISNHVDYHGGYYKVCRTEDFTDALEKYYDDRELMVIHGTKCRVALSSKYQWKEILTYFETITI
jgi:glycosyltransferase involved in cell wall biosynthesis